MFRELPSILGYPGGNSTREGGGDIVHYASSAARRLRGCTAGGAGPGAAPGRCLAVEGVVCRRRSARDCVHGRGVQRCRIDVAGHRAKSRPRAGARTIGGRCAVRWAAGAAVAHLHHACGGATLPSCLPIQPARLAFAQVVSRLALCADCDVAQDAARVTSWRRCRPGTPPPSPSPAYPSRNTSAAPRRALPCALL